MRPPLIRKVRFIKYAFYTGTGRVEVMATANNDARVTAYLTQGVKVVVE